MTWTVVPLGALWTCGGCGESLPGDSPVALLTTQQLRRCPICAGGEVNGQQVDAVRQARDAAQAEREQLAARPVRRVQAGGFQRVSDFARLPVDGKAKAAGE